MSTTLLGTLMIVAGLILASGGVVVRLRAQAVFPAAAPSSATSVPTNSSELTQKPEPLTSAEKGIKFEQWVVKRFSRDYFTIKEWRGDKYVDGIYPKSSINPDLEIEFYLRERRSLFAVECKWRSGYQQADDPYIDWASDWQIGNYSSFAKAKDMPVFVIIGIGGAPDGPAEVFVLNLTKLRNSRATAEDLAPFRREKRGRDFYYNDIKRELE